MKYWQAIKHVCKHPEDTAVGAFGWQIDIDESGNLSHRLAHARMPYAPQEARDADWRIKSTGK